MILIFFSFFSGGQNCFFRASCFGYFGYHSKGCLSKTPFSTLLGLHKFFVWKIVQSLSFSVRGFGQFQEGRENWCHSSSNFSNCLVWIVRNCCHSSLWIFLFVHLSQSAERLCSRKWLHRKSWARRVRPTKYPYVPT